MKNYLIILSVFIVEINSFAQISLCQNITTISSKPVTAVMLVENSTNALMTETLSDASCWLQKNFNVKKVVYIDTSKNKNIFCYKLSSTEIEAGEILIAVTNGMTLDNCFKQIFGPLPNILNIKMFIDIKNHAKKIYTRRIEIQFENAGGFLSVQYDLFGSKPPSKIRKSLEFMMRLNSKSYDYGRLGPWWSPLISVPPDYFLKMAIEENTSNREQYNAPSSFVLFLSCLPVTLFGIIVSCYLVNHPIGGLIYTDEEFDVVLEEVASLSKVNVLRDTTSSSAEATTSANKLDPPVEIVKKIAKTVESPEKTKHSASPVLRTALSNYEEIIKTEATVLSTKSIRTNIKAELVNSECNSQLAE